VAQPAKYTSQIVIMAPPALKAAVFAAAEQDEVSASESARRWLTAGMAADPGANMPARQQRAAQIEAELAAAEQAKAAQA